MNPSLYEIISDSAHLLALEPEELAGYILEHLNSLGPESQNRAERLLNRQTYIHPDRVSRYPREDQQEVMKALTEAWEWLRREGLFAPRPGESEEWVFITRRGKKIKNHIDLLAFRHANLLPKTILHPIIAQKVWSHFIRGEYDTAVFQAFKEVEVAVRKAGNYQDADIGVPLMRKAFHPQPDNGPLTDMGVSGSEQQALADFFAGAIGSYKNPHSHRHVRIDAPEAVEMIMLASHLLRIVDSRESP